MVLKPQPEVMPIQPDGVIRVGGTRVTLDTIVNAFNRGMSAEEIAIAYSALTLADVYEAIAYYLRHRQEVDAYIAHREQQAEKVRQDVKARHPDMVDIRARLQARLDAKKQT